MNAKSLPLPPVDLPKTSRESDKFMLRLPDGMREQLKKVAVKNGRTLNAEIVARLEASFEVQTEDETDVLDSLRAELENEKRLRATDWFIPLSLAVIGRKAIESLSSAPPHKEVTEAKVVFDSFIHHHSTPALTVVRQAFAKEPALQEALARWVRSNWALSDDEVAEIDRWTDRAKRSKPVQVLIDEPELTLHPPAKANPLLKGPRKTGRQP